MRIYDFDDSRKYLTGEGYKNINAYLKGVVQKKLETHYNAAIQQIAHKETLTEGEKFALLEYLKNNE